MQQHIYFIVSFNLDSAIEREKGVYVIGVHRKLENFVVSRGENLFHLVGDKNIL